MLCERKPYESPEMLGALGDAVRPGGLDLTRRALEHCAFTAGQRVLDIGCGSGATVGLMMHKYDLDASGIDLSETAIASGLRRSPGLPLQVADGRNLPFGDGDMDGVIMECTLTATGDTDSTLSEAFRVLKRGGRLAVSDMYLRATTEKPPSSVLLPCLEGAVDREKTVRDLEHAGFRLRLWEDQSDLLKELATRIIMKYGSLSAFWSKACGDSECRDTPSLNGAYRNYGYYLAIAQRL